MFFVSLEFFAGLIHSLLVLLTNPIKHNYYIPCQNEK